MLEELLKRTGKDRADSYGFVKSSSRTKAGSQRGRSATGLEKGADRPVDRMLRCRYELKYHIGEAMAEAVERFIRPYLHLDHYCKLRPSGTYPIATLYLDSADLRLCRQTLEGNKNRFKLRIRSYTDDTSYPCFVA